METTHYRMPVAEFDGIVIEEIRPKKITGAAEAYNIFKELAGDAITKQEHFMVIALDAAGSVSYAKTIFIGTLNQSLVHPREVFADAITGRAAAVIIGHNHPGGTLSPSGADERITERLKKAGEILGIEVLDHIIATENGYYSFDEDGTL